MGQDLTKMFAGKIALLLIAASCGIWGVAQAQTDQTPQVVRAVTFLPNHSPPLLGVFTIPASETLRAHLKLERGTGLVVLNVAPESAAEKAGLKAHDVLVSAGEDLLRSPIDLMNAVRKLPAEAPMKLKIVRAGAEAVVEVTPAQMHPHPPIIWQKQDWPAEGVLKRWVPGAPLEFPGDGSAVLRMIGPGTLLLKPGKIQNLPKGLSVSIQKSGDQPASISVQRTKEDGEKESWKITEDELDKLPQDLQGHVRKMLGRTLPSGRSLNVMPMPKFPTTPQAQQQDGTREGITSQELDQLEERLERRVERLQQALDRLMDQLNRAGQPPQQRPTRQPEPEAQRED